MTSVFASRRRAEEFNSLVEAPHAGAPRSGRDAHLEEFLSIVESLRAVPAAEPRPEFVASLRAELMAAADTLLVPATDDRLALPARNARRDRRLAAAIGGLAVVGAGTSMAVAAQSALPGEMLYPLKRVIEDAQTGVAQGGDAQALSLLDSATSRLSEVSELGREGRAHRRRGRRLDHLHRLRDPGRPGGRPRARRLRRDRRPRPGPPAARLHRRQHGHPAEPGVQRARVRPRRAAGGGRGRQRDRRPRPPGLPELRRRRGRPGPAGAALLGRHRPPGRGDPGRDRGGLAPARRRPRRDLGRRPQRRRRADLARRCAGLRRRHGRFRRWLRPHRAAHRRDRQPDRQRARLPPVVAAVAAASTSAGSTWTRRSRTPSRTP